MYACSVRSVESDSLRLHGPQPLKAPLSMGIVHERILECVGMPSSRDLPQDQTRASCTGRRFLYQLATWGVPFQWINLANSTLVTLSKLTIS